MWKTVLEYKCRYRWCNISPGTYKRSHLTTHTRMHLDTKNWAVVSVHKWYGTHFALKHKGQRGCSILARAEMNFISKKILDKLATCIGLLSSCFRFVFIEHHRVIALLGTSYEDVRKHMFSWIMLRTMKANPDMYIQSCLCVNIYACCSLQRIKTHGRHRAPAQTTHQKLHLLFTVHRRFSAPVMKVYYQVAIVKYGTVDAWVKRIWNFSVTWYHLQVNDFGGARSHL